MTDTIHTTEIVLSDLPTKSVTFTPRGVNIVREIQDVAIQVSKLTSILRC